MLMVMKTSSQTPLGLHPQKIIDSLVPLVDLAGKAIMTIYCQADLDIEIKDDQSPLTQADLQANRILVEGLKELWPSIPVLSEEGGDDYVKSEVLNCFWAVDPLDGTKEFIGRNREFTVNVALIYFGVPILGIVSAPALDKLYVGYFYEGDAFKRNGMFDILSTGFHKKSMKRDAGKWRDIEVSRISMEDSDRPLRIASSRSHPSLEMSAWLEQFQNYELTEVGSSLKLCMVAEGLVDIYPRFGNTCVWDIAAGHAILMAAGGSVYEVLTHLPLQYGESRILNPPFIASAELNKLL